MRALGLSTFFLLACNAPLAEVPAGCNPLVGDDCLTPFPSSFFQVANTQSATGVQIALGAASLPVQSDGTKLDPQRLNQKDGFSPATPFLVYFKAGVQASDLPDQDHIADSLTPASTVQMYELGTGARVPLFAELDLNALAGDRQALLIHPAVRLKPGARYAIALVGLHDAGGRLLAPPPFVALRDKHRLTRSLMPLAARSEELFAFLQGAGVARASLSLAWDVQIASDRTATGHLTAMRDQALAMADAGNLHYSIKSIVDQTTPYVFRTIYANIEVPSYLLDDSGMSMMNFGSDGEPAVRGISQVPIVIQLPACVTTQPAPIPMVVLGHGLFGNAKDSLQNVVLQQAANSYCAAYMATDWIGLATSDVTNIAGLLASDLNNFFIVTDRLQQAHVNAQVMTRLFMNKIKNDPILWVNGAFVFDQSPIYYYGVSNGAIQGATFMGISPDIARGVLNVPGGEWSLLIFRSAEFNALQPILSSTFPDALDRQVLIAVTQSEWDYTDAATFAPHLIQDPLPGLSPKRILIQESIDDAVVSNVATRVLARTIGLPALKDLVMPVFGITEMPGPLDSAYTQWNSRPMPTPPVGDKALPSDNGAHTAVYQNHTATSQVKAFLKPNGQVIQVCQGPCTF